VLDKISDVVESTQFESESNEFDETERYWQFGHAARNNNTTER